MKADSTVSIESTASMVDAEFFFIVSEWFY